MFIFAYYLSGMYIKTLIADFWLILQTVMTVLHYVYIRVYESAYIYIYHLQGAPPPINNTRKAWHPTRWAD